jgi:hypothetical protein
MKPIKLPKPGGSVSAGAFRELAESAQGQRLGVRSGSVRMGGRILTPPEPHVIQVLAKIDDATARPIAAGAPYNCVLTDAQGAAIAGSDFRAYSAEADLYVPDGQPVTVFPCFGEWGFLRPRRLILFDGICGANEDAPTTPHNGQYVASKNDYATGNERQVFLHLGRRAPTAPSIAHVCICPLCQAYYASSGDVAMPSFTFEAAWVVADFDPTALTWNNRPACSLATATTRSSIACMPRGPWSSYPAGYPYIAQIIDTGVYAVSHWVIDLPGIGSEVFGVRLRVSGCTGAGKWDMSGESNPGLSPFGPGVSYLVE